MARGLVTVVLVLGLLAGSAGAAELTGFGPIKFGMTKEEALAALEKAGIRGSWKSDVDVALEKAGIKGKWESSEDSLYYDYPIHEHTYILDFLFGAKFRVKQMFRDGLAIDANLRRSWKPESAPRCFGDASYFVAALKGKYTDAPMLDIQADDISAMLEKDIEYVSQNYIFVFERESLIKVTLVYSSESNNFSQEGCVMIIWYHAPVPEPMPF